jgi:predicted component of type VI protein secretion system
MHDLSRSTDEVGEVSIDLLDPLSGRPMKSWEFIDQERITIGRSPEQDVAMSDPYISRSHAELVYRDGGWLLLSLGRNGVMVANQLVAEHKVESDLHFRLGIKGPTLHFRASHKQLEASATISFDVDPEPMFHLDETRIQQEVTEIAEGDYFQDLKQRARQMRLHRKSD